MTGALVVSEVFGPTVQGEGPSTGRRCAFVRLGRCNLSCRWCDTPFTWDWKGRNGTAYDPAVELTPRGVSDLTAELLALGVGLVVVSGGEPLLQATALAPLVHSLTYHGLDVEVETNGTRFPLDRPGDQSPRLRYNVSPKLAHAGDPEDRRIVVSALHAFTLLDSTAFKFVVQQPSDLDEVADVCARARIPDSAVWIMPEGITPTTVNTTMTELADAVVARGWNLTSRLHVQVWGNRRGV